MHIPENYLSPVSCAVMGAAIAPILAVAASKVKREVPKERIPLLGIGSAFSFLIMMFNIPLPGGTTAHAVGGTLLAVVLGPWPACISIAISLLLQALLFGDGGVLSLGANSFNMAFVMPFLGYSVFSIVTRVIKGEKGEVAGLAAGSFIGINAAALFTAIELGLQPLLFTHAGQPLYCPYPLAVTLPTMLIPHLAVVGAVEALFSVGIFAFIRRVSPGTIRGHSGSGLKPLYGLLIVLILITPLGLLAAGTAWGEWGVSEIAGVTIEGKPLGFVPEGMLNGRGIQAFFSDYSIGGVPDVAGYIIAAVAGVAIIIILFKLLAMLKSGGKV